MLNVVAPLIISVGAAFGALYGASDLIRPMRGAHTDALTTAQNFINGSSLDHSRDSHEIKTLHSA